MGGCAYVICKYYVVLYKGLKHPQILVSMGSPGTSPPRIPRDDCSREGMDVGRITVKLWAESGVLTTQTPQLHGHGGPKCEWF